MDLDVYEATAILWVHDGERNAEAVCLPAVPVGSDLLEGGRGLHLVEVLTERWFVWPAGQGKAVVAVISLGGGQSTATV